MIHCAILYCVARQKTTEGGTTYSFTGYTKDSELVDALDEFVEGNELIASESKAVVYAVRSMLQEEEYINE